MEPFDKLIKEYYVPDVPTEVVMYLHMASHKIISKTEEISERFGITRAQFNILNILYNQYPQTATVNLLRERTLVVKSDVSRIVMRLQKAGLIDCTVNKNDRRSFDILINEKGRSLFDEVVKHKEELLKPFLAFSSEEIAQLKSTLRKLLAELEKENGAKV